MKYPQLVSPRAVNAISDWLVSRLEQLGVESPQIYTRLLLSLLQSSVQVNDPIEFSNLEAFFANRKGGHKRFHLPSDTETLKKLNAVQCLREIVSNEQETATIENLVDELCEKFKDIEKQSQNLSDEERFLIETHLNTSSLLQTQNHTQLQQQQLKNSNINNPHDQTHHHHPHQQQQQQNHHHQHPHNFQQQQHRITQNICNNPNSAPNTDSKRHHALGTTTTTTGAINDLDNDPKNRYFRAFPALSKEMEDSFLIWRRNAKSLTWPIVGRSIVVENINNSSASLSSSSASSIISSANVGANSVSTDKSVENKLKNKVIDHKSKNQGCADISGSGSNIGGNNVHQYPGTAAASASVKKKSKRRRNQALGKVKPTQNIRKLSSGTTSNSVGVNKYYHYTHHRNSSPAWDTDFKGCWEMGPDLIKEFLSRQNGKKRNRRNSDSMNHEQYKECTNSNEMPVKNDENIVMEHYIDLSFCYDDNEDQIYNHDDDIRRHCTEEGVDYVDEDYDDNTLASVSELAMDNFNPKRLYQREGCTQKSLALGNTVCVSNIAVDNSLDESFDSVDPLDFQQFKAKFNSTVEALWKDAEPTVSIGTQETTNKTQAADNSLQVPNPLGVGISSAFYATTSLNALAPFKKDLWNFWSNYQQQHYDRINNKLSTTTSSSSMITTTHYEDSSASSGTGLEIGNSSDYFSMPSNLDDFDKSVGSVRRTNEAGASLGIHTPSINVFLQNSIWSTSGDCVDATSKTSVSTAADTDQSFLFKVWHSNKKLSELDVGSAASGEKIHTIEASNDGTYNNDFKKSKEPSSLMLGNKNVGANLPFPSYQNLKWSEGINAGPPYDCLRAHGSVSQLNDIKFNDDSSLRVDNSYSSFNSVASISGTTWKAPTSGQNAQPDLKSWCASNPMSLTEMYGNDVCDSIVNQSPATDHELQSSDMAGGSVVTLPNHCANTSGFVAYSRIKQCGVLSPQVKPVQISNDARVPKDFFRESEEENLLTSERTHFHPIENFVDGHTFDISNALDPIDFERTSSGLMRYECEEYLEYIRNDIYMADEEVATNSTNFLKFGRRAHDDKSGGGGFIIKFRVKRSGEIACQTEDQDFQLAATNISTPLAAYPPPPPQPSTVNNMVHKAFSLSRQANNEAIIAAVTKAVAAAAKAAAENNLNAGHFCWLPITNINTNATASDISTNTNINNPQWRPKNNSICDEVDFCKNDSNAKEEQQQFSQNWSMLEVEKQCHQRSSVSQHRQNFPTTSSDIDRSEENSLDNSVLHTLWGMCAVCNDCEYGKSMPANRLLRDELQLEADEIMSDLRYMQDLYISESDIETQAMEENALGTDGNVFRYFNKQIDINSIKNPWSMDVKRIEDQPHDPTQFSMLQKVNQLIEDLLKPENMGKLPKEEGEYNEITKHALLDNVGNSLTEHDKRKIVWPYVEHKDKNIWQHKHLSKTFENRKADKNCEGFPKSMELLKQVGGSLGKDTQYMENLNWEHDNLAKIWQQSMQPDEIMIENKKNEMEKNIINRNLLKKQEETSECIQTVIEEKNLKNMQNLKALTPPSTFPSNTYKRVQQFFNNSAAKMKLVANRKRRHSASQNFYQHQHLQYNSNSNQNNNNDNLTDLNFYKENFDNTLKSSKEQQQYQQQPLEPPTQLNDTTTTTSHVNSEEQPTKQTIITCKYWTTATNGTQSSLDSATAAMMLLAAATNAKNTNDMLAATTADNFDQEDVILDDNIFGNTFSYLIDKNASILKHVTMMTRPLTR